MGMAARRTALHSIHKQMGARMVEFAGWEMPVQYQGTIKEHLAVRQAVAVFDVSHMGQLELIGEGAVAMAQKVTCNDLARLSDGQVQYSALLSPQGTFLDDVVVYRFQSNHIFICVNASTREKDFQWLIEQKEPDVEIIDSSDRYALLALQGPKAEPVLQQLTDVSLSSLKYYWFLKGKVDEIPALISRTGYTGEDGFEIYVGPESAERVWCRLLKAGEGFGMTPAGLAARNTLRLEVRYPLYGNDIDETTTPWEAGLDWIVSLEKGNFIGKAALQKQKKAGVPRYLRGFEMIDRGIARDHYSIYLAGKIAGSVTSGSFAPYLQKSIGLAYLPAAHSQVGQGFEIDVRGRHLKAKVVKTPFYKRKKWIDSKR